MISKSIKTNKKGRFKNLTSGKMHNSKKAVLKCNQIGSAPQPTQYITGDQITTLQENWVLSTSTDYYISSFCHAFYCELCSGVLLSSNSVKRQKDLITFFSVFLKRQISSKAPYEISRNWAKLSFRIVFCSLEGQKKQSVLNRQQQDIMAVSQFREELNYKKS